MTDITMTVGKNHGEFCAKCIQNKERLGLASGNFTLLLKTTLEIASSIINSIVIFRFSKGLQEGNQTDQFLLIPQSSNCFSSEQRFSILGVAQWPTHPPTKSNMHMRIVSTHIYIYTHMYLYVCVLVYCIDIRLHMYI